MKTFLRKAIIAVAAMIASVNVMAQSLELKKEFGFDFFDEESIAVFPEFTKDGNPRLLIADVDEEENYENDRWTYRHILNKLSIWDKNLNIEKEFTSGALFEEYANVTVTYAAKTLKVDSVFKISYYNIYDFYNNFYFFDEKTQMSYPYEMAVQRYPEEILKPYLEKYAAEHYGDSCKTTYNGYNVYFYDNNILTSNFFDWGKQYPSEGWIYKAYNDVEYVRFYYSPDELEEIERYTSSVYSAFYADVVWYYNFFYESETGVTITQTLFNNDEKYEFCLPVMDVFTEEGSYSDYYQTQTIQHRYEPIGYKIVSEDGTVLQEIIVNEARDNNLSIDAVVMQLGDKTYFVIGTYSGEYGKEHEMTYFYEINKNTNSIQKVREVKGSMRVTPTVANRNEEITISINDDNCNVARELIITGVNGKLIERRTIPAGVNTFKVNAAMMRSGMYNFTLQKKGEFVDNSKVIVK